MSIVVVYGGSSCEREVSLESGKAVYDALISGGESAMLLDVDLKNQQIWSHEYWHKTVPKMTSDDKLDIVFLALHGGDGEDGHIQSFFDSIKVAYTGSGMLASALAMDKHKSKILFYENGIPTPNWQILTKKSPFPKIEKFPVVVKPNSEGSSLGLTIVEHENQLQNALEKAFSHDKKVLIEQFIVGRELTVSVVGDEVFPVVEILPSGDFYDYESKYLSDSTEYIVPAEIDSHITKQVQKMAFQAFKTLDCTVYGRVDFRMNSAGELFCLEVNTLPGLTSHSLLPKAALANGLDFFEMIMQIIHISKEKNDTIS